MGSFDVGCGLSNLTIHYGDKAGILILDQRSNRLPRSAYGSAPEPGRVFLSGNDHLPFLPPVYGVYDDYGRLRDIRPSATTQVLETLFNRSAKVVIDCIVDMRGVYDSYGEIYKQYKQAELEEALSYGKPVEEALLAVGFEEVPSESGFAFEYGSYKISHGGSGHLWTVTRNDLNQAIGAIRVTDNAQNVLDAFSDMTGSYPGFAREDFSRVRLLNRIGGMFFLEEVFTKMDEFSKTEHYMNTFPAMRAKRHREKFTEFLEHLKDPGDKFFPSHIRFADDFSRDYSFPMEQWELLKAYESNKDEFFAMESFKVVADSVNRLLAPTYCGEQMGNDRASLMLNHISKGILDVRQKEYEDETIEDESEEGYWNLGVDI